MKNHHLLYPNLANDSKPRDKDGESGKCFKELSTKIKTLDGLMKRTSQEQGE